MSLRTESQPDLFSGDERCLEPAKNLPVASKAKAKSQSLKSPTTGAPIEPEGNGLLAACSQRGQLFFTDREVATRYGVSRPTVWRWVKTNPRFPSPVPLAAGTTRWCLSDLEAYERTLVRRSASV